MSKPALTIPPLPYAGRGLNTSELASFDQDLSKALTTYLADLARRANDGLPKDGSEPMQGNLNMGGFSITNVANITVSGNMTITGDLTVDDITADDITVDDMTVDTISATGNITSATTVQGSDLIATDDLTVGDDATITGDLDVDGIAEVDRLTINGIEQWETIHDEQFTAGTVRDVTWTLDTYAMIDITFDGVPNTVADIFFIRWIVSGSPVSTSSYQYQILYTASNATTAQSTTLTTTTYQPVPYITVVNPNSTSRFGIFYHALWAGFKDDYQKTEYSFSYYASPSSVIVHGVGLGYSAIANVHGLRFGTVSGNAFQGRLIVRGHR